MRDRPLFVVARSITAPVSPDCGTDRFTTMPGIGHRDDVPHPQASQLAEPQAGQRQHEGDVRVPTRDLSLLSTTSRRTGKRERVDLDDLPRPRVRVRQRHQPQRVTPGADASARHTGRGPAGWSAPGRRPDRPGHRQVDQEPLDQRRRDRRDRELPEGRHDVDPERALVRLPRPHRNLPLAGLPVLLGELPHRDPPGSRSNELTRVQQPLLLHLPPDSIATTVEGPVGHHSARGTSPARATCRWGA